MRLIHTTNSPTTNFTYSYTYSRHDDVTRQHLRSKIIQKGLTRNEINPKITNNKYQLHTRYKYSLVLFGLLKLGVVFNYSSVCLGIKT